MRARSVRMLVKMGDDTESDQARIDRARTVVTLGKAHPLYQTSPAFKETIDQLEIDTEALAASLGVVNQAVLALGAARGRRDTLRGAFDKTNKVATALVEANSTKPEDMRALGYVPRANHGPLPLTPPTAVEASYDPATGTLTAHVKYAGRNRKNRVQMSPDPASEETYKDIKGSGVTREVEDPPKGIVWVRAATVGTDGKLSDWVGPVPAVVK